MPCTQAWQKACQVSCPPTRQPCLPHLPAYLQEELDLTGSREFLTKESAEEMLAPMLAPGARITKVRLAVSVPKLQAGLAGRAVLARAVPGLG